MNRRAFLSLLAASALMQTQNVFADEPKKRNVTWNELISTGPEINYTEIFSMWTGKLELKQEVAPIGMSAFGNVFFQYRDGSVHVLDPIEGKIRSISSDFETFSKLMNTEAWQIVNLHSMLVAKLVSAGMTRKPDEAYALAPHPRFVGGISLDKSKPMVMTARIWHSICSQSF